ncbi:hypothetical protein GCM10023172_40940 [Hymenobacter ginsengisoli]|uniref:Secretion system C-terminal sorting domain-containing protein n=1 Tax=Hymenobacter ginsengisoli TaxID=1051626 RepID=A0ABP8QTU8_9BACT|nr:MULTISPECIES: T9SS type A sorting domain-containing protein [unclassified Hymenobacter]MBO2032262.1 T9SS type A sorting domain-containing protein [Hymenobacter sp. BT559]
MRLATRLLTLFLAGLALLPAAATTYGAHQGAFTAVAATPPLTEAYGIEAGSLLWALGTPAPGLPGLSAAKPATTTGLFTPPSLHAALASMPSQTGAPLLSVFPNPARGLLTVQLTAQHGPDYKMRLSNVLGREVRLLPLPLATAATGLPLDVTGLPAGLYFCSLLVNDKAVSTNRLTLL